MGTLRKANNRNSALAGLWCLKMPKWRVIGALKSHVCAQTLSWQRRPIRSDQALKTLGANLRTARLRRNLSIEDVAAKIGVGRHVVADAEKGKPSTGIAIYAGLLWAFGLTEQLAQVADPETDEEGRPPGQRARAPSWPDSQGARQ